MTPTYVAPDGALRAPERNRFFYGKLMDVAEFEKEQSYFRRQQALVNRLAIGSGVLAGLDITAVAGKAGYVRIAPGAAIDGAGRIVVVPAAVEIDAHQATDAAGNPTGSPLAAGTMLISVAYAEGSSGQVAVMTPHCDAPGECADSSTVESFVVVVRKEDPVPTPSYGCQLKKVPAPPDPSLLKQLAANVSAGLPALPADVSVPLGRVNLADGSVDNFTERQIVFSNPMLWQLSVCLAQQVGAIQGSILRYVSGDNQTGPISKALAAPLIVELVNGAGTPVSGAIVQFQPAAGTVAPVSVATDQYGRAQAVWTLGATGGQQTLTAGAVGSPLSVVFRATATK